VLGAAEAAEGGVSLSLPGAVERRLPLAEAVALAARAAAVPA
jgi:hypothetical protein